MVTSGLYLAACTHDPIEPSPHNAEALPSKFRRIVWVGLIGCITASLVVTFAGIVSVDQLPAAPIAPPPVAMAPAPEPIKPAPTISATEIAMLVARGEALLAWSD